MRFDKFFFLLLPTFAYHTSDSSLPYFMISYLSIVSPNSSKDISREQKRICVRTFHRFSWAIIIFKYLT